jgi:hypothetical protein
MNNKIFPRFRSFKFTYSSSIRLDAVYVGRLDRLAEDLFGNVKYYKPIAVANGIKYPIFTRKGIRNYDQSVIKDIDELNIDLSLDDIKDQHDNSVFDWNNYGDVSSGAFSELYEGKLLNIPTQSSADAWLSKYETL